MALPNTNIDTNTVATAVRKVRFIYILLLCVFGIFGLRLFYLQVIRYDHYKQAALNDQLKQYVVPASRGIIKLHDGDTTVPIVLNQKLYTLYADPVYIKHPDQVAADVAGLVGGNSSDYLPKLKQQHTRYVVLGKKLSQATAKRIAALKHPGLGTIAQDYRTYPQRTLASQVLGFVNSDGKGVYGVEQALNKELTGKPGELKAITDVKGIPLAASPNNIEKPAVAGDDLVLTLDLTMQQLVEGFVHASFDRTHAEAVSAVVMEAHSGAVKAMANYPTYDPTDFSKVTDPGVFTNAAVSHPIEVGSIMKALTTAAALDQKVVNPNTTYYDPARWTVDKYTITNIEEDGGAGVKSLGDILNLSLNTGATWELMQMGGGQINQKAREAWHGYLVDHYRFGRQTGIEQGYEASGYIPKPANNGAGINLTYANTSFGQAMTATPVQMAGALAAVVNGGTYYQPHLIDQRVAANGTATATKPEVLDAQVVSPSVSQAMIPLMQFVVNHHNFSPKFDQNKYIVGGKTGTAQVAKPGGGYYDNEFNGTYIGFVGGDKPQYVIVVFVRQPHIVGYAGTAAAQPVFSDIAHMLINNGYVSPKTN